MWRFAYVTRNWRSKRCQRCQVWTTTVWGGPSAVDRRAASSGCLTRSVLYTVQLGSLRTHSNVPYSQPKRNNSRTSGFKHADGQFILCGFLSQISFQFPRSLLKSS